MKMIPVFVGMDYHQDSVQVCVQGACGKVLANRKCANDIAEIVDVAERCGEVAGAAIESCTGQRIWPKSWSPGRAGPFIWLIPALSDE